MPMGCRNALATHQRRMTSALRHLIGKICHVYLDDIIIWSQTVEEHVRNVRTVLAALRAAHLYCSPKKTQLFCLELDFLGHHISAQGIEADSKKVDKILAWPRPASATDVRAFLGLVRYISAFLPNLAAHTRLLTPLTTKEADLTFPPWSSQHEQAFQSIKSLVVSRACLTTIDHQNPLDNHIYVTTDASDFGTGAVLSFGTSWETARPVAFDSSPLNSAERNYPVHEKELLAVVRALHKWRVDLLGSPFQIHTDHRTLQHFLTQRNLSRRQARWQEALADFDFQIHYVKGEDNTVADALSRVTYPSTTSAPLRICSTLAITTDPELLQQIVRGYADDPFTAKLLLSPPASLGVSTTEIPSPSNHPTSLGVRVENRLLYLHNRLVIPRTGQLCEILCRLAHDSLGHFGADKSYAQLRHAYYWKHMRRDLEDVYIPGCDSCQRNKSSTIKRPGPLHPLPIPDRRGDSVAIDFVGPLPDDLGYNYLLTMTDRLNADIRLIPCRTDITAEQLASLFFDHWYCENGLPLTIVSDRDHLFLSAFWRKLHQLSGVKLHMSTAFHPQTDGASERTNKTIIQALRYAVDRHQKGWVRALPRIRFEFMNSVNASTGYSPFNLHLGRSPRIIPPIDNTLPPNASTEDISAHALMRQLELDC